MRRHRRGENAIEFALVLPVLLVVLFGIFEMGWYFNRYLVVSAATRDGARAAAMVPEDGDVEGVARQMVLNKLSDLADTSEVAVSTTVDGVAPDRTVTVTVTTPYTAFAGRFVPAPSTIESTFSLHMEEEPPLQDEVE